MAARRVWWLAWSLWLAAACGDTGDAETAPAGDASEEGDAAEQGDAPPCEVPSEPGALLDYLRRGDYKDFAHESKVHASSGPHGGRVFTYVNDVLADSLASGASEHPRCAASIKELYLGNAEVSGWSVLVKTSDDSRGGRGYYWLETTSTREGRKADYEGQGLGLCVGCHSAGQDYFRTPWPLQ